MKTRALIAGVVHRMMALVARLATAEGRRSPLASVPEHAFAELSHALRRRGLAPPVIADMFGVAPRTWWGRLQRARRRAEAGHTPLAHALHAFIEARGSIAHGRLRRAPGFAAVGDAALHQALATLIGDGRVVYSGSGDRRRYAVLSPADCAAALGAADQRAQAAGEHLAAVFETIAAAADRGRAAAGGSTYVFEVGAGHPRRSAVLGLTGRLSAELTELSRVVRAFDGRCARPGEIERVVFYCGQSAHPVPADGSGAGGRRRAPGST